MSEHVTLLQDMKRGINCRLEAIAAIESLENQLQELRDAAWAIHNSAREQGASLSVIGTAEYVVMLAVLNSESNQR